MASRHNRPPSVLRPGGGCDGGMLGRLRQGAGEVFKGPPGLDVLVQLIAQGDVLPGLDRAGAALAAQFNPKGCCSSLDAVAAAHAPPLTSLLEGEVWGADDPNVWFHCRQSTGSTDTSTAQLGEAIPPRPVVSMAAVR